jgi:hypothetical protein
MFLFLVATDLRPHRFDLASGIRVFVDLALALLASLHVLVVAFVESAPAGIIKHAYRKVATMAQDYGVLREVVEELEIGLLGECLTFLYSLLRLRVLLEYLFLSIEEILH